MKTLENQTVNEVVAQVPGAREALYARNMSASGRYTLANAAAAAGVNTAELLAVMEYRMRNAARRASAQEPVVAGFETEVEGELVA
jgi:iron-sulfur cluster repair protein YtfE (RIC family)